MWIHVRPIMFVTNAFHWLKLAFALAQLSTVLTYLYNKKTLLLPTL